MLLFSCQIVSDSATPWTAARQAPLSMGFSRQESWSGLPCPPPGGLPDPGVEPAPLASPAPAGGLLTPDPAGKRRRVSRSPFPATTKLSPEPEGRRLRAAYTPPPRAGRTRNAQSSKRPSKRGVEVIWPQPLTEPAPILHLNYRAA